MKMIFIFMLLLPIIANASSITGQIIDSSTDNGIEGINVIIHRIEPNAWENVTYSAQTNIDGQFIFNNVENGQYRLYTSYSDDYFTAYQEEIINISNSYSEISNQILYLDPILESRGEISGHIFGDDFFFENTVYFMTLQYFPTPNYQISMGFQEIVGDRSYSFPDLNTGNYKIGILFYGRFSGEIWYDTTYSEDTAQILEITSENPIVNDINFTISFETLNQPFLQVNEVIIDYGWDDILTFGETFTISYKVKNVGNLPSEETNFFAYSPYEYVSMDFVNIDLSLQPDNEIILGPFEVSIDYNIENNFNFHLYHSFSDGFGHNSDVIFLTAYAPDIQINSYEILSNNGYIVQGNNTLSLDLINRGSAPVNYPIVSINSDNPSINMGQYNQTNYYWMEAENGQLEMIFDFELIVMNSNLDEINFQIDFSSLNTDYLEIIDFNLPIQTITNNLEELPQVNEISLSNYPNPFNPETIISFSLPQDSKIVLDIYNLKGQLVKRLVNDDFTKGNHQVVWKGNNQSNQQVTSGIYMYKLQTNKSRLIKKMILQK